MQHHTLAALAGHPTWIKKHGVVLTPWSDSSGWVALQIDNAKFWTYHGTTVTAMALKLAAMGYEDIKIVFTP